MLPIPLLSDFIIPVVGSAALLHWKSTECLPLPKKLPPNGEEHGRRPAALYPFYARNKGLKTGAVRLIYFGNTAFKGGI